MVAYGWAADGAIPCPAITLFIAQLDRAGGLLPVVLRAGGTTRGRARCPPAGLRRLPFGGAVAHELPDRALDLLEMAIGPVFGAGQFLRPRLEVVWAAPPVPMIC